MPIYEYQCSCCDHHLEVLQKVSEDDLSICPECQAPGFHKIISRVGFRLKGGGWYETDFKTGTEAKRNLVVSDSEASATAVVEPASGTANGETKEAKTKETKNSETAQVPEKKSVPTAKQESAPAQD